MQIKKNDILAVTTVACSIAFIIPLLFFTCFDSLSSVLVLSFTAVGAIASLATFIIAALLYERFSLDNKFIDKQADKVLELVDLLKGRKIIAMAKRFHYYIRPNPAQLDNLKNKEFYKVDSKKKILLSLNDYEIATKDLLATKRSYWLPKEIKDKMEFLDFAALEKLDNINEDDFIKFDFGTDLNKDWGIAFPEMTLEDFVINLQNLVREIEKWLQKYSSIPIDLKLEEHH